MIVNQKVEDAAKALYLREPARGEIHGVKITLTWEQLTPAMQSNYYGKVHSVLKVFGVDV